MHEGINPYLIRDKGYPLLLWLMVPHMQISVRHFILQALLNKRLSWARILVENNFSILKKTFREFMIQFKGLGMVGWTKTWQKKTWRKVHFASFIVYTMLHMMMTRWNLSIFSNFFICDLCIVEAHDLQKFAKFKFKTPLFLDAMDF